MASLGQRLREAREGRGLRLEDVEASTRIRKAYLLALENEEYEQLPHPTYVKGFLKTYASCLGIPPQEVLDLYPHKDLQPAMAPLAKPQRAKLGAGFWAAVLALLLLVLGLALYVYAADPTSWISISLRGSAPAAPEEVAPTIAPVGVSAPPLFAAPPSAPSPTLIPQRVEVRARAIARSWVLVTVDSTPVFTGTLEPGQERTWEGKDKVSMRVGNAGGLVIVHNGQERGVLGNNGQVLDVQWTRDSMSFDINTPPSGPR